MSYWMRLFLAAIVIPSLAVAARATAAPKAKLAITDIAQVGVDYHYAGEFVGWTTSANGAQEPLGLQVVAQGDGQFSAVMLRGGLPGDGWNRSTKVMLQGRRHGQEIYLESRSLAVALNPQQAIIRNRSNVVLARLHKTGRISPTLGAPPPPSATILFGEGAGDQLDQPKITADGLLVAGTTTNMAVGDFHLHLEFRTPYMPYARGQARGNSGVYIQRRYEVQILDSFGLEGAANECGGLYRQRRPDVNMCLPPLTWQTYDIYFTAARWSRDGRTKLANARITVLHNGTPVHNNAEILAKTGNGKPEGPQPGPIHLQFHGNPVQYRNIWIVPGASASSSPHAWPGDDSSLSQCDVDDGPYFIPSERAYFRP